MTEIDTLYERFETATEAYHAATHLEVAAETAALQLLAGHALAVAPNATHMLMESSDQGNHMCYPLYLTIGDDHEQEQEWDAHVEEYEDDLSQAASWLTWGHEAWEQFVDEDHEYTNVRSGYYAMDLRRIKAAMA